MSRSYTFSPLVSCIVVARQPVLTSLYSYLVSGVSVDPSSGVRPYSLLVLPIVVN